MKKMGKKKKGLDMKLTLILFAIIPMIVTSLIISIVLVNKSSSELKTSTHNSLVTIIKETGAGFDVTVKQNELVLKNFLSAPIVKECLQDPDNAELMARAQAYTLDYFGKLEGWEGIYLSTWDTVCRTHPSEAVVGRQFREGDYRQELWDGMLNSDNGVYNTGIITSPASGQLIISMYAPIMGDNGEPIGYAGGGTFVNEYAEYFTDVSSLGLSSAYIYFVDKAGTMLYHPDESKIGNPVENAAVKGLVAKLEAGEHPEPECIEYVYKGAKKYAAYYVAQDDSYIAVLTADEKDVISNVQDVINATVIIVIICVILFVIIAILVARYVAKPLATIAKATETLSTGDVTVECKTTSHIAETISVINAFNALKAALMESMTNVKDSADALNTAIINVDEKTANNVDAVSQISVAIDEVADTSQAVASNAQDMAQKATELDANIGALNQNVSTLYDASLAIKNANNEATECMDSVYASANESVAAVKNITDKIVETNDAITEISTAVQAIESIAAQTNLLSLNASIEAARAGEAGRGFAVVADEIRTLADSSALSAKEIKQIIENVVELSGATVEISNRVFEVISKEQDDIETTQEKFTILSDSVESSIAEITTIKQMADELDRIKVELTNATTDLGAISEELGASAQEVSASCQEVTGACTDTQASTEEMRAINDHMITAIEFFKLQ